MFVIKWLKADAYVRNLRDNKRTYTTNLSDARQWVSRRNAQAFLDRKDPQWSSNCEIIEVV